MNNINLDEILERGKIKEEILSFLDYFYKNKFNKKIKRSVYLHGNTGSGKTYFVKKILQDMKYDIVYYNSNNTRNSKFIKNISSNYVSDNNILSLFNKKQKKIVILMDEIDSMNNGDKGGINSLITLIRPKKTSKQKKEFIANIPIIIISNNKIDKKIKELKKYCICINLKDPTIEQLKIIFKKLMPDINQNTLIKYSQYNLKKINLYYNLYKKNPNFLKNYIKCFSLKNNNENRKIITKNILYNKFTIKDFINTINETDRTSIGLLFHENIIDIFNDVDSSIDIYIEILKNINYCDYIDRITFQKQIWIFNEMSSIIKLIYNNNLLLNNIKKKKNIDDIRFTKVLTKYSTEYNNIIFIQKLCKELNIDKKDLFVFFFILIKKFTKENIEKKMKLENYNIDKLDIVRIYRYLEKIF